jgi:hypothetical protein
MEIFETEDLDGKLKTVPGYYIPLGEQQLLVPERASRYVVYEDVEAKVKVTIALVDSRFEVVSLGIGDGSQPVYTRSLTKLSLPKVVREIALRAIPRSDYWTSKSLVSKLDITDDYLAQLYWFEYITRGAPREAIMQVTGWSRANANYHIRRISKFIDLPNPSSEVKEKESIK